MRWSETVQSYIQALKPIPLNQAVMRRLFSLIDLTSLHSNDTEASIADLCKKAETALGHVAAVCVFPTFVSIVANQFADTSIKTATVVNFPQGNDTLDAVLVEMNTALQNGAQEIDMVLPYSRYLAGEREAVRTFVTACKAACGEKVLLKVILETGALPNLTTIANASEDALLAGADFIKTSTGKITKGANLEAVATMLLVVKRMTPQLNRTVGVKASGGISHVQQAVQYIALADHIMGNHWVSPATFRIGASKLVDEINTISLC